MRSFSLGAVNISKHISNMSFCTFWRQVFVFSIRCMENKQMEHFFYAGGEDRWNGKNTLYLLYLLFACLLQHFAAGWFARSFAALHSHACMPFTCTHFPATAIFAVFLHAFLFCLPHALCMHLLLFCFLPFCVFFYAAAFLYLGSPISLTIYYSICLQFICPSVHTHVIFFLFFSACTTCICWAHVLYLPFCSSTA